MGQIAPRRTLPRASIELNYLCKVPDIGLSGPSRSARTISASNWLENRRLKAIQHEPGQPQNNPGYTTNEWGQSSAHRTKDIGFSTLYAAIIGFGTQGSQVRILPLRPLSLPFIFQDFF
jgi:hypothetical protein